MGGETVERGDFSGPLGARAVARDRRVTMAILETARGGLLRRGVPVPRVTAAALTNIAADHLGDYGIETVPDLARAKLVVAKALGPGGVLVAPADEPAATAAVLRQRDDLNARGVHIAWTALDPEAEVPGGLAASVVEGQVALREEGAWRPALPGRGHPGGPRWGRAPRRPQRADGGGAGARARAARRRHRGRPPRLFRSDPDDNPGRANRFSVGGASVVIDYAHNAHGLRALADLSAHWPAQRRLVMVGSAGDRSDADLAAMADVLVEFGAERFLVSDLPGYLRGRAPGEVPRVLADLLGQRGVAPDAVEIRADPAACARAALDGLQPGDLAVLITLAQRDEVLALVREAAGETRRLVSGEARRHGGSSATVQRAETTRQLLLQRLHAAAPGSFPARCSRASTARSSKACRCRS